MTCFLEIALSDERHDGIAPALDIGETFPSTIPKVAPRAASLFEPVRDRYGWRLALVFGNHAPNGRCPYYPRACFHCDIGAGEGSAFDHATNRRRLDWFRDHYRAELDSISHLVLYNSGSILNPREMPPEIAALIRSMAVETSIFVGWHDEGHDQDRPQRDLERGRAAFDQFNQTNDPDGLNGLG
jgi:hypothetical protein